MRRRGLSIHVVVEIRTGSAKAGEGRVEIPLALLVNKPLFHALKHISSFFTNSVWLTSFYLTQKYFFFYSFSLNSHSGYTQLGRHY